MKSLFLLGVFLTAFVSASVHQSRAAAEASPTAEKVDADLFFHLGEVWQVNKSFTYYQSIADKLDARYDEYLAIARKAGAPPEVIESINTKRKLVSILPWTKVYHEWSDTEKKGWTSFDAFNDEAPWTKWLKVPDFQKSFFWYLGGNSMTGWYVIEKDFKERKATPASFENKARVVLRNFVNFALDNGYENARKRLTPEALKIIQEMNALKKDLDDPLGSGVTADTITKIGAAGRSLRDLSRAGKLVSDPVAK